MQNVSTMQRSQVAFKAQSRMKHSMPPARKFVCKADANVVSIKFGHLSENADEMHAGDPVYCCTCNAVLNFESRIVQNSIVASSSGKNSDPESNPNGKSWECEFCLSNNMVDLETEEVPKQGTVDYIIEPAKKQVANLEDDSLVVFVIDVSGSMCTTKEVQGKLQLKGVKNFGVDLEALGAEFYQPNMQMAPSNSTWVSRLQAVQISIEKQLEDMAKVSPSRKVCLISFNRQVTIIGDGTSAVEVIAGDKLMNQDLLEQIGSNYSVTCPISRSKDLLLNSLYTLEEDGPTALGPALVLAVAVASKVAGSSVIVCTDGLANVGLGSFDSGLSNDLVSSWYNGVGEKAKSAGINVNVISLKGDECSLSDLGRVSEVTGGFVDRVDPLELTKNFASILSKRVIATHVKATLLLNKAMQFHDENPLDIGADMQHITRDVGNVTEDTQFTFQFTLKEKTLLEMYARDSKVPFQLKIEYTKLDGMKCLRVITKSQLVTDKKDLAEADVDINIIAANAAQKAVQMGIFVSVSILT